MPSPVITTLRINNLEEKGAKPAIPMGPRKRPANATGKALYLFDSSVVPTRKASDVPAARSKANRVHVHKIFLARYF